MALSGMQMMLKSMGVDMNEVNNAMQVIPSAVNKIVETLQRIEAKQDVILITLRALHEGVSNDGTNGNDNDNRIN